MPDPDPRRIVEHAEARPPSLVLDAWKASMPWLAQGTTTRAAETTAPYDLGLYACGSTSDEVRDRLRELGAEIGADRVVIGRQVHGARVRVAGDDAPAAAAEARGDAVHLEEAGDLDGHLSDRPGVLLVVTAADCVPVSLVDPGRRAIALLHAGWRGIAAGVLEAGIEGLRRGYGSRPADLLVHLGPSMCADCYEVGPEVFEALGRSAPERPAPIGLRELLAERASGQGVDASRITISAHCTRCTASPLFSHRGGDGGRHVGFLGIVGS